MRAVMSDASLQDLQGSVFGGGQVPEAIDRFIDQVLRMSGMSASPWHRDGSAREVVLWGAFLLQAKANCTQARANLQQAKTSEDSSHNLLMGAHFFFSQGGCHRLGARSVRVMVCRAG